MKTISRVWKAGNNVKVITIPAEFPIEIGEYVLVQLEKVNQEINRK